MKLLFVGEGRHDIGDSLFPGQPRSAEGTIPTLARRICPAIDSNSVALAWNEIARFNPQAKKRGFPAKITAAVLLADRRFGCTGTVVVSDRDGDDTRQAEFESGVERARELFSSHPTVWGLAFESVEAWTLGIPHRIAEELNVDEAQVRSLYPRGIHVEKLSERSGKPEHQPKRLLEQVAQLKHESDSTAFRQAVAERTEPSELETACPNGFAPFAGRLREAFCKAP